MDDELNASFARDGFAHVKGVFSPGEISRLRGDLERIFASDSPHTGDINGSGREFGLRVNPCARYPELRWVLMHPGLLSPLRSLLGEDFLFLPEMSAHQSGYGNWHKDTSSQERAGHTFHWKDDFRMIQVALYLQDNTDSGGGLTVVPGSHNTPDKLIAPTPFQRARNILRRLARPYLPASLVDPGSYRIPSRAGDLVMFHFRLDHMATTPRFFSRPKQKKLVLFFATSANNEHARTYRAYIQSRETYHYLREPTLYPEVLRQLADQQNVRLMS